MKPKTHRTLLKITVNPILRLLQFWTWKPYVIGSIMDEVNGEWIFLRYTFSRVRYFKSEEHLREWEMRNG